MAAADVMSSSLAVSLAKEKSCPIIPQDRSKNKSMNTSCSNDVKNIAEVEGKEVGRAGQYMDSTGVPLIQNHGNHLSPYHSMVPNHMFPQLMHQHMAYIQQPSQQELNANTSHLPKLVRRCQDAPVDQKSSLDVPIGYHGLSFNGGIGMMHPAFVHPHYAQGHPFMPSIPMCQGPCCRIPTASVIDYCSVTAANHQICSDHVKTGSANEAKEQSKVIHGPRNEMKEE